LWVSGLVVLVGSVVVYNVAQNRYRRYPTILALHEWIFWPIAIGWGLTPLLAVIHVPFMLILLVLLPSMGIAIYATFIKFPPLIAAANNEIRRRRFVPPPRRDERERPRPTPAGRRRTHRR
ncbi:MAG: hypothetical protein M3P14_04665, partial [Chloroflexota bacterium]|nr:hypothetical protein [Chloroflexota bacterium]